MRSILLALCLVWLAAAPVPAEPPPVTSFDHLRAIVDLSPAPTYRRAGAPGMDDVAEYVSGELADAGYAVVRHDFGFTRWAVDYAPGSEPLLERVDDGARFRTESAFNLSRTTSGLECVVKHVADVESGDCGFVPFGEASPEWKNQPFARAGSAASEVASRGGVGVVIQGDVRRDAVFSQSLRNRGIPGVVSVVHEDEIIGRRVRLRAMGSFEAATGHNVVGVHRPHDLGAPYVMLLAHADGWFSAAADNGSGIAGVLRAAELLAQDHPEVGVLVAAVDAEEVGLIGSTRLAEALDDGLGVGDGGPPVTTSEIKAIVNLDASTARASDVQDTVRGVVRTDAPLFQWRAMVSTDDAVLSAAFVARFASHGVLGLPLTATLWQPFATGSFDGGYRTDVQAFAERGIPFVWPVSGYPEYHTSADTLGTVDPADLEAVATAAAEMVWDLQALPLGGPGAAAAPSEPPAWLAAHLNHDH